MALFERSHFATPDDDAGIFMDRFGEALTTWVAMQGRERVTVAEAMAAWNTTGDVIREAAREAHWLYLDDNETDPAQQLLCCEGE